MEQPREWTLVAMDTPWGHEHIAEGPAIYITQRVKVVEAQAYERQRMTNKILQSELASVTKELRKTQAELDQLRHGKTQTVTLQIESDGHEKT